MTEGFEDELRTFARAIIKAAGTGDVSLAEKVDAFKVLTGYLGVLVRRQGKSESDDESDGSFSTLRREIEEAQDHAGIPQVRNRRGRTFS